jgi:PAS domain S-box-containing protein
MTQIKPSGASSLALLNACIAAPILFFVLLVAVLKITGADATLVFDHPALLFSLNLVFLFLCPMVVVYRAGKDYLASGSARLLTLQAGVFSFALGSLLAGMVFPWKGPNAFITMQNSAVLLAGMLYFAGAVSMPLEQPTPKRGPFLFLTNGAIALCILGLTVGLAQDWTPVFFVQNQGPTVLRQIVLGTATLLFLLSGLLFLKRAMDSRNRFLSWYAMALLLIAVGLGCVFLQKDFWSPVGWVGRTAQYLAGLYFLVAVFREAQGTNDFFARVFNSRIETMLDERTKQVAFANEVLRLEIEHRKRVEQELRAREEERIAHIRFLEHLEQVDRAIMQTTNVQDLLWRAAQTVFTFFNCDRIWLVYPCDPDAPTYHMEVEITKPEYPGAGVLKVEVPMSLGEARNLREALESNEPVTYVVGTDRPITTAPQFKVQSTMFIPLYPRLGRPWVFGMHQCSHPRVWTNEEKRLFQEVSRRIADALSNVVLLREFQENEERFRATFEQAAVGIAHVGFDGRWLRVNQKLCDIVGYSREELLQKTFLEITHPDDQEVHTEVLRKLMADELPTMSIEKRYVRKGGQFIWVNLSAAKVKSVASGSVYFISVVEDVTEKKRAEEALRETKERYQQLFQNQPMGYALHEMVLDKNGEPVDYRFLEVNREFEALTGLVASEILGKTVRQVMPKTEQSWIDTYGRVAMQGHTERFEQWSEVLGRWFDVVAYSPQMGMFAVIFRDITRRVTSEKELEESRNRYVKLLNSVTDYIYSVELSDGNVISTKHGPGCLKITGYTSEEFASNTSLWFRMVPESDIEQVLLGINDILNHRETKSIEHRIVRKDDSVRWVRNTPVPQYDERGLLLRYDGLITDITERKQAEESLREKEEVLRVALDATNIAIWDWNIARDIWHASPKYFTLLGYEPQNGALDRSVWVERVHPEDRDLVAEKIKRILERKEESYEYEARMLHADGSYRWHRVLGRVVERDEQGKAARMLGVRTDITERKQVEDERQETLDLLSFAGSSSSREDLIKKATGFFMALSGCEAIGIRIKQGQDYPYFEQRGFPQEFVQLENTLCARDDTGRVLLDSTGNPVLECMCGNIISGRFDPSKPFFTKFGSFWSNATSELLASTSDADRQARTRNRCNTEGYESVALIPLRIGNARLGLVQLNDKRRDQFTAAKIAFWERLAEYLAVAVAKIQAEEELQQSEAKFEKAFMATPLLVTISNVEDGRFVEVNDQFCAVSGFSREETVGKTSIELGLMSAEDRQQLLEVLNQEGRVRNLEVKFHPRNGSPLTCLYHGEQLDAGGKRLLLSLAEDITEKNQLQQQLVQAQKMEAVGTLAGGIAHDFNNILSALIGYSNLLKDNMAEDDPLKEYVDEMLLSSEKAAKLTQRLLAFSRKQVMEISPQDVNTIVSGLGKFLRRFLTEDMELKISLADADMTIMADITLIDQVLLNLATNARDAMPKGGRLTIKTQQAVIDEAFIQARHFGTPGVYARISVIDTGSGIDEKIRSKIFDPFFTTKVVGKGTGLGLSIVYGMIKQHHGFIDVESELGKGTAVHVYLPITTGTVEQVASKPLQEVRRGVETILVAEDDEKLRKLMHSVIQSAGYHVIEAEHGDEAIQKYQEHQEQIALLVLDVVMPRKNGMEAYLAIRKIKKDIKVLFMSGYTGDVVLEKGLQDQDFDFISKPVTPHALLTKIRAVLDKQT